MKLADAVDYISENCRDVDVYNHDDGSTAFAWNIIGGSDAEKAVNAVLKKIEALENEGRNLREERDQMEYSRLKRKYGEYA
jgi:hypothetical protein